MTYSEIGRISVKSFTNFRTTFDLGIYSYHDETDLSFKPAIRLLL
jgi:hypothetical protein